MKKDGGIIINWQIHNLSFTQEQLDEAYPNTGAKPMILTGTVKEDPTGRWQPGYHMRSTVIVNFDEENGIVETLNTIYKVEGASGTDCIPDLGNGVLNIFY